MRCEAKVELSLPRIVGQSTGRSFGYGFRGRWPEQRPGLARAGQSVPVIQAVEVADFDQALGQLV